MDTIRIHVNQQTDGTTYSLPLAVRNSLKEEFPNAHPLGSLYVKYDVGNDFEFYHGTIYPRIYPVLLGLSEADLKKINHVVFVNPLTNQTIYEHPHE